jgi:hypothetical protein
VQGLAPAGILFPHFLLLEKENGRDRRGDLRKSARFPRKGSALRHDCLSYIITFLETK